MIAAPLSHHRNHRSRVQAFAVGTLAIGIAGWSSEGFAQPTALLDLSWEAPPNCPQRADVEGQLRQLLGDVTNDEQQPIVHANGVIIPKDERFELTLSITEGDSTGQRVVLSDDCNNLDRAAAVVLGLLIRRKQTLAIEHSNQDASKVVVASSPASANTRRSWRLLLAPNLAADFWTLPQTNLGVGLAVGLFHAPWRWSVAGTYWKQQSKDSTGNLSYRTSFQRQSVEAWTCRGWSAQVFEVAPCVLLALDHISARASGARLSSHIQDALPISAGAGALGYWHIGYVGSLVLGATGRVMTSRAEFVVEDLVGTEQVHRLPLGTVVATIAYEWIF